MRSPVTSSMSTSTPSVSSSSYSPRFSAGGVDTKATRRRRQNQNNPTHIVKPKFLAVASQKLKVNYPFLEPPQIKMKALELWKKLNEEEREDYVENQSWRNSFIRRSSMTSSMMSPRRDQSEIVRSPLTERSFNSPQSKFSVSNRRRNLKGKVPSPPPKPITPKRLEKLSSSVEEGQGESKALSPVNLSARTSVKVPQKTTRGRVNNLMRKSSVVLKDIYSLSSEDSEISPEKKPVPKKPNRKRQLVTLKWASPKKPKPATPTPTPNSGEDKVRSDKVRLNSGSCCDKAMPRPQFEHVGNCVRCKLQKAGKFVKSLPPVKRGGQTAHPAKPRQTRNSQPSPAVSGIGGKVNRTPTKTNGSTENKMTAGRRQTRSTPPSDSQDSVEGKSDSGQSTEDTQTDDILTTRSGRRIRKGIDRKAAAAEQKSAENATGQDSGSGTDAGRRTRAQTVNVVAETKPEVVEVTGGSPESTSRDTAGDRAVPEREVRRSTRSQKMSPALTPALTPTRRRNNAVVVIGSSSSPSTDSQETTRSNSEQEYLCNMFDRSASGRRNSLRRSGRGVAGSPATDTWYTQ